jgi:hypothetical protein
LFTDRYSRWKKIPISDKRKITLLLILMEWMLRYVYRVMANNNSG